MCDGTRSFCVCGKEKGGGMDDSLRLVRENVYLGSKSDLLGFLQQWWLHILLITYSVLGVSSPQKKTLAALSSRDVFLNLSGYNVPHL